jgi:hypothetical protein
MCVSSSHSTRSDAARFGQREGCARRQGHRHQLPAHGLRAVDDAALNATRVPSGETDGHSPSAAITVAVRSLTLPSMSWVRPPVATVA